MQIQNSQVGKGGQTTKENETLKRCTAEKIEISEKRNIETWKGKGRSMTNAESM